MRVNGKCTWRILWLFIAETLFLWSSCFCYCAQVTPLDYLSIAPIREVGSGTDELGYAASKINSTAFKQQSLTTVEAANGDDYQFTSYYGADQKLVVGRRKKLTAGWSDWTIRKTEFTSNNINDSHNVSVIAVDGDGYLHMSWGMHNDSMLYTRSALSVTNDSAFTLVGDTTGNSGGLGNQITTSSNVTYPNFYYIPGSDDLLLSFRIGSSGNGDLQLHRWDAVSDVWNPVHAAPSAPWIDGDLPGDGLVNVNAYTNYASFDSQGNLHTSWTWRTGGDSPTPFGDYQSNHNIMYARSPNQGVDWFLDDGTPYQRSGVHAIDESNATPVVTIPEGSSIINQSHMMVGGPNDTPYISIWWAPNAAQGDHLRQFMLAWESGGTWQTSQVSDRNPEKTDINGVSQRVPENQLKNFRMTRPIVAVDDEDRVIVAFTDWQRGKKLTIAYSEDTARDDWVLFDLNTEDMGWWEPNLDLNRWQEDGVISMFYQVENIGQASSTVSVLEWDARSYFEDFNGVPFIRSDLNVDGFITVADWIILRDNNLVDLSSLNPAQQYLLGDVDRDGDNDLDDYDMFISDFESANGAGAFAAMIRGVPEPSSLLLIALGCIGLTAHGLQRQLKQPMCYEPNQYIHGIVRGE